MPNFILNQNETHIGYISMVESILREPIFLNITNDKNNNNNNK